MIDAPVSAILKMRRGLHKGRKQRVATIFEKWPGTDENVMTGGRAAKEFDSGAAPILALKKRRRLHRAGLRKLEF